MKRAFELHHNRNVCEVYFGRLMVHPGEQVNNLFKKFYGCRTVWPRDIANKRVIWPNTPRQTLEAQL